VKTSNAVEGRWMIATEKELMFGIVYGNRTLLEAILNQYHAVEDTRETTNELVEYVGETNVTHDTEVVLCHRVNSSNILEGQWMISTSSQLKDGVVYGDVALLEDMFSRYHVNESGEEIYAYINVSHDMYLTLYHIIQSQGELNGTWYAESDDLNLTKVVNGLSRFFESDQFVIGDRSTSSLIEDDILVTKDMNIVVMNPTSIEILLSSKQESFNSSEIAEDICNSLDMCDEDVIIHPVIDSNSKVVTIIIMVRDEVTAEGLADSVNNIVASCEAKNETSSSDSSENDQNDSN